MKLRLACPDFAFPLMPHDQVLSLIAALEFRAVDIVLVVSSEVQSAFVVEGDQRAAGPKVRPVVGSEGDAEKPPRAHFLGKVARVVPEQLLAAVIFLVRDRRQHRAVHGQFIAAVIDEWLRGVCTHGDYAGQARENEGDRQVALEDHGDSSLGGRRDIFDVGAANDGARVDRPGADERAQQATDHECSEHTGRTTWT